MQFHWNAQVIISRGMYILAHKIDNSKKLSKLQEKQISWIQKFLGKFHVSKSFDTLLSLYFNTMKSSNYLDVVILMQLVFCTDVMHVCIVQSIIWMWIIWMMIKFNFLCSVFGISITIHLCKETQQILTF